MQAEKKLFNRDFILVVIGQIISLFGMATLVAVAMCGQPIGQMVYGILFDVFIQETWVVMFVASIASIMISIYSKRIFQKLEI